MVTVPFFGTVILKLRGIMFNLVGYAITDVGVARQNNEDNFYLFGSYKENNDELHTEASGETTADLDAAAVFDGMGGEASGEVASLSAASDMEPIMGINVGEELERQITRLNAGVCEKMSALGAGRMGCTIAGVYFFDNKVVSANVGDSRCYLFRDNNLFLLSHDHSEGQRMLDMGQGTEEEIRDSRKWHVLTQCLGIYPDEFMVEPYVSEIMELKVGDRFLVCSDGITDPMRDSDIEMVMRDSVNNQHDIKQSAEALIDYALTHEGKDNVTVVLVDVI